MASYFKSVLIDMFYNIVKKYDGRIIKDKYGKFKFENGKCYSWENRKWELYNVERECIEDITFELETILEELNKNEVCKIEYKILDNLNK